MSLRVPWAEVVVGSVVQLPGGIIATVADTEPYYDRGVVEIEFLQDGTWKRDMPIPFHAWAKVTVLR